MCIFLAEWSIVQSTCSISFFFKMAVLEKEDFWGGKLSKSSPVVKFNPEFEDSELSEVDHKLILSQACLGSKASGRNVVEVTAADFQGNECTHTIVALREGSTEMCTLNLTFNAPATFKLVEGSGPVHLTGSHVQSLTEGDEEESDEESDEEVPNLVETKKQQKRPLPASTPKGPPNKVAKVEEEEESDEEESDEEESDEEEEDESDEEEKEKSKKPADKKDKKQESKKQSNLLEKEAEEGEESEEESDEESDEDEEDESDEEEDDSDDEEESDEEEDEVTATLTGKKKQADKKPMTNGVGPKKAGKEVKTPQAKTPQQKTPQTKTPQTKTPQTKTPQTKTPQTKTPQTKTPQPTKDIESIKQALVKSPALPKKLEKFQNLMRSSYKITDKDTVKDLWDYVQKNKK